MKDNPRRRRLLLVGLTVLAVLATGIGLGWMGPSRPGFAGPPPSPTAGACGIGPVDVEGGVVELAPTVPGRVAAVLVKDGSVVRRGDVLLRVEDRLAALEVEQARAALDGAGRHQALVSRGAREVEVKLAGQRAVLEALRHRLKAAELVRDRAGDKVREGLLNARDAEVAAEQVRELQAQLEAEKMRLEEAQLRDPSLEVQRAGADVAAARARLEQTQEVREQHLLRAPADGTVLRLRVSAGDLVAGQPGRPVVEFWPADRPLVVRAELDQESAQGVREGDVVRVFDYYTTAGFQGTGRVCRVAKYYAPQRAVLDEPGRFKDARTLECVIDRLEPARGSTSGPALGQLMRVEVLKKNPPAAVVP
jgi:multidrug resistance efflux pump